MTNHSHFQPRCFLLNHFTDKRNQKVLMQREGLCFHKWFGVSVAKPATHHHPLSFRETGEVILGTYCVLGGVLTVCVTVFVAPLLCMQEVSGRLGMQSRIPEESLGSRGPVLPSSPCWAAGGARHEDSRVGGGGGIGANEQKRC